MKYLSTLFIMMALPLFLLSQQSNKNDNNQNNAAIQQSELGDRVVSKATWDFANNRLGVTETFTGSSGGPFEFLTGFKLDHKAGEVIESIYLHLAANTGEALGKQKVVAYIYLWEDDGDHQMEHHELSIAAKANIHFNNKEANSAFLNMPVTDIRTGETGWTIPGNDTRIFVGIRQLTEGFLFIGFDETIDVTLGNRQTGIQPIDQSHYWTVEWEDNLPFYLQSFRDFHAAPSIGVVLNSETSVNTKNQFRVHTIEIYPNPVSGQISVHVNTQGQSNESLLFTIHNKLGSVVYNNSTQLASGKAYQIDVQHLPPGFYVLNVTDANSTGVVPFVIQR